MNIGRFRLANQHVTRPVFEDAADVVRWLGAVQAQDYLGALWAVGLRMRNATQASVEEAVARGSIIRTWPMRGTLHFVPAEDARWMLGVLTPRVIAGAAGRHRQLGLDGTVFRRAGRIAERALVGGRSLRRAALYALWNAAGIATGGSRGLHIVSYLAQTGLLCFGRRDGKQHTFTLLEEWVTRHHKPGPDEALGALARRYFTSHGPATVRDFAWWSGLTLTDARAGLESVRSELTSATVGDRVLWWGSGGERPPSATAVHLLPAWDEFTVAYRERGDILDASHARHVNAGGGVLNPVVVAGGRVVGTWKRTLGARGLVVRPFLFGSGDDDALASAVRRYGAFLGAEVRGRIPGSDPR